ncbi:MAG: glucokinase [Spirochaetes bacterium]|nr:glucokinase [Spirochaetota bacterium]
MPEHALHMETIWIDTITKPDFSILVGDIGGTHTSLGLVGKTGRSYSLLVKFLFKTRELGSIFDALGPVQRFLSTVPNLMPVKFCSLSVAGPVQENRCVMTNVDWEIRGLEIESFLGVRTLIINDFTALSFALPLLNPSDSTSLLQLTPPDGSIPIPHGFVRAVIGAGTGLGVGVLVEDHGKYIALPSEGGHSEWAGLEGEGSELFDFIRRYERTQPEAEHVISGPGIGRIYQYLKAKAPSRDSTNEDSQIDAKDLPSWVASRAETDPLCRKTMDLFIQAYARFAYNIALTFLPSSGLYLAGGIVGKNINLFQKDHLFYRTFLNTPRAFHRKLLESIPLYIVKDYSVSLLGAAHAAYSLL